MLLNTSECYAKVLCMSSVHKQDGRRPFYFCSFMSAEGKRLFRSTKTKDKRQAEAICAKWQKAEWLKQTGKLTPERAREVIQEGVADIFLRSGEDLPRSTVQGWREKWLQAKELETETSTHSRYKGILKRFVESLGNRAKNDLSTIRANDIQEFRDSQAKLLSKATANLSLKVLRVWLGEAVTQGYVTSNVAAPIKIIKGAREKKRRPFTLAEISTILESVKDSEWQGLVLVGIYTGQRLGDIAMMTWQSVDLEKKLVRFVTQKTGRRIELPIAKPLQTYLENLPSSDSPKDYIFPKSAEIAANRVGTLSNQFHEILGNVGLVTARSKNHEGKKSGRKGARETSELSFHCLRHSTTTILKAAGISDVITREIVGHSSEETSKRYTHLEAEHLKEAIESMPDVTKAA